MPIGKRSSRVRQRGATYLLLLFILALLAAGTATWAERWQVAAQRERESELLFRGLQLRDALQHFHDHTPEGAVAWPAQLDDLQRDARHHPPAVHLRRLYTDPFSGRPDWVLLRNAEGGIVGLHSSVERPAMRRHGLPQGVTANDGPNPKTSDWQFLAVATNPASRRPGSQP